MQSFVKLEHSGATIISVSTPLVAVMGQVTALMEVMRLDVVSGSLSNVSIIYMQYNTPIHMQLSLVT